MHVGLCVYVPAVCVRLVFRILISLFIACMPFISGTPFGGHK